MATDREDEALLAAIRAAPDDDAPRLVYADRCLERGDARGELIVLQCSMAVLAELDPLRAELEERCAALLRQHQRQWSAPLRALVVQQWFVRGFVERVAMKAAVFITQGAELFAVAPVRQVILGRLDPSIAMQLRATPLVGRLDELALGDPRERDAAQLGPHGAADVLSSPHLARLRALAFYSQGLRAGGAEALARARGLVEGRLVELQLYDNHLGEHGATCLSRAPWLARLASLEVSNNQIGDGGLADLLREVPALTRLGACSNALGPKAAAAIARASARLEHLDLRNNALGRTGAAALAGGSSLEGLRSLRVSGLDDPGVAALTSSPHFEHLELLDLDDCTVGRLGAQTLLEAPLPSLQRLQFPSSRTPAKLARELRARWPAGPPVP